MCLQLKPNMFLSPAVKANFFIRYIICIGQIKMQSKHRTRYIVYMSICINWFDVTQRYQSHIQCSNRLKSSR